MGSVMHAIKVGLAVVEGLAAGAGIVAMAVGGVLIFLPRKIRPKLSRLFSLELESENTDESNLGSWRHAWPIFVGGALVVACVAAACALTFTPTRPGPSDQSIRRLSTSEASLANSVNSLADKVGALSPREATIPPPPRAPLSLSWLGMILAGGTILLGGGTALVILARKNPAACIIGAATALSGTLLGSAALVDHFDLSPFKGFGLSIGQQIHVDVMGEGRTPSGAMSGQTLDLDCEQALHVGPFRLGKQQYLDGGQDMDGVVSKAAAKLPTADHAFAGVVLLGSTDRTPLHRESGYPGDNAQLAEARAHEVARLLKNELLEKAIARPMADEPIVLVLNGAALPIARLTLSANESLSGREVIICTLWRRPPAAS